MIYNLGPWKVDIDREETAKIYEKADYSEEKKWNRNLIERLNEEALDFFEKIGVDLMKIEVSVKVYDFHEDGEDVNLMRIAGDFAVRGKFLEIPLWQAEFYEDDELLGQMPETIKKTDEKEQLSYEIGNLKPGIVFKPPYFRVEKGALEVWDSGYIVGSILIFEE